MSKPAIVVENLSKSYRLKHSAEQHLHTYTTLREVIGPKLRHLARTMIAAAQRSEQDLDRTTEQFWALRNVEFTVDEGEILGIVGYNGAGKSTLLKILSRITDPTSGRVILRGRIASLLEVGTGFHPELTGRENIFLNGAILGMSRADIRRKFDEIVAFSEVERFLDTPVKRYSSGMYVRLAFAVAAHLEPEILVVDEVLAVGDARFQKKCLGKIDDVSQRQGRTVLFVSHNMGMLTTLCPTALWLEHGAVRARGPARQIVDRYLACHYPDRERLIRFAGPRKGYVPESNRIVVQSVEWISALPLRHGESMRARIHFEIRGPISSLAFGFAFSSLEQVRILTYDTDLEEAARPDFTATGIYSVELAIDSLPLAPDIYNLDIVCRSGGSHVLDYLPACSRVEVIGGGASPGFISRRGAAVRLPGCWSWDFRQMSEEVAPAS